MNKRIKKKIERKDTIRKKNLTGLIVNAVVNDWIMTCLEVTEKGPIGPVRYRTYLKYYNIHKRDTELGSSINQTVNFN